MLILFNRHQVLPYAIQKLQAAGYQLVTVAECLGMPAYQSVVAPGTPDVSPLPFCFLLLVSWRLSDPALLFPFVVKLALLGGSLGLGLFFKKKQTHSFAKTLFHKNTLFHISDLIYNLDTAVDTSHLNFLWTY